MTETANTADPNGLLGKHPILFFILLTFLVSHILNPVVVETFRIFIPGFSFSFPMSGLNERSILNQYGGTLVAVFLVIRLYGIGGLKSTLRHSKLNMGHARWLLISVFMPLFIILTSYCLAGVSLNDLLHILRAQWQLYLLVIGGFILSAGIAEEYGWRGFLLPQLLKTRSPLIATFIVFIVVSLWHFPALIGRWKDEPLIPWMILSVPIAITHSWLFFKSKGNLIVTILYHACFDAQYSFFSNFISATNIEHQPFHQGWTFIILNCIAGLAIIAATKGKLGFNAEDFSIGAYFGNAK